MTNCCMPILVITLTPTQVPPKLPSPWMGEVYPPLAAPKATRGKGGGDKEYKYF